MTVVMFVIPCNYVLACVEDQQCGWSGKGNRHISTINTKLTFWMHLTNLIYIRGVFDSSNWSRDWSDSEWHFQGPKWGFTPKFIVRIRKLEFGLLLWMELTSNVILIHDYPHKYIRKKFNICRRKTTPFY